MPCILPELVNSAGNPVPGYGNAVLILETAQYFVGIIHQNVCQGANEMRTAVVRVMTATVRVLLALSFMIFFGFIAISQAQTATPSPPPEKVEQLLKLLDDPEVKAWITAKGTPPPAEEISVAPSASDFMLWSNAIRAHLRGIAQAIPAVPTEFAGGALHDHDRNQRSRAGSDPAALYRICCARLRGRICLPACAEPSEPTNGCAGSD